MNRGTQGWTMLIFLVIISLLVLLATNGFRIASTMMVTARMRYRRHQEVLLLDGLLTYGIQVCDANKALLLAWGAQKSQTMALSFNPWPSQQTVSALGRYIGSLTITSNKGVLFLGAQMSRDNAQSVSGSCILRSRDVKNPKGQLLVSGWRMQP